MNGKADGDGSKLWEMRERERQGSKGAATLVAEGGLEQARRTRRAT